MLPNDDHGSHSDQQVMATFQYKQELRRTIRLFGSFAVAFSFISITTGIFVNYSDVLQKAGPAGFWTWPIVTVGQLLVALVFAELAGRIPLTGYSYQWVTRLAGPGWGWFTGWVAMCFLIIVVPSVDHGLADVIGHMGGFERTSPWLKLVVCVTMMLQALIHVSGVRLANVINSVAVFTEVVGMVGLVIVFAALALYSQPSLGILFERGPSAPAPYWPAFMMASLIGAYTLVGFESAANLSEETVDAERTVPKAVIGSVVVSGVVGTLFLLLTVLGIKDLTKVMESDYPLPAIIDGNLGGAVATGFFALVVISIFACGLVIMASGSRLIYAMARDRVFVANWLFKRVSVRTSVPVPAVLLVMALGIAAELFSESLQQLVLAATVLPAVIYLMTVAAYVLRRHTMPVRFGTFSLGRWGTPTAVAAIIWLIVIIAILTVPEEFHRSAAVSLALCLIGLVPYFSWIRPRILSGQAGLGSIRDDQPEA